MDLLTHVALGGVIAQTGFSRKLGNRAVLLGITGGLLPDLDIGTGMIMGDPWVQLTLHRGITHSILIVPFVSAMLAWIFWRWCKKTVHFGWWYLLAFLVLCTHILLDCCTSYGTQILAPLSDDRVAWHCLSIVDIFYTLPLLLAFIVCLVFNRYRPQKNTCWLGIGALFVSTLYIFYGAWNHNLALMRTIADANGKGVNIVRAEAFPQLTTVWFWRTVVKTPHGYLLGRTNTLLGEKVTSTFLGNDRDALIEKACGLEKIKVYRWFADGFLLEKITRYPEGGGIIQFFDMRYGNPLDVNHYLWGAQVHIDQDGNLGRVERFYNRSFSAKGLLKRVIKGIVTP